MVVRITQTHRFVRKAIFRNSLCCLVAIAGGWAGAQTPGTPAPDSRAMLSLIPERATISIVLPALPDLLETGLQIADRFLSEGASARMFIDAMLAGGQLVPGLTDVSSLRNVMDANGFSSGSASAVIFDFTQIAANAAREARNAYAAGAAAESAPVIPAMVAAFGCHNAAAAQAYLLELARRGEPGLPAGPDTRKTGDIEVTWFGDSLGFCSVAGLLFVANDPGLLAAVLDRATHPAPPAPDRDVWPADIGNDIVLVTRVDRVMAGIPDFSPLLRRAAGPQYETDAGRWVQLYADIGAAYAGESPLVTTVALRPRSIECVSRLNTRARPELAVDQQELPPLQCVAGLAAANIFNGFIRGTEPLRWTLRRLLVSMPASGQSNDTAKVDTLIQSLLSGTISGWVAVDGPALRWCLAACALDNDALKSWLDARVESGQVEVIAEGCWRSKREDGSDLFIRFDMDKWTISDSEHGCGVPAQSPPDSVTGFLESLERPVDPERLISLYTVNMANLASALRMARPDLFGPEPAMLDRVLAALRELRAGRYLDGEWQRAFLTIYLQ